jgi:ArsR family transcriptional regulator, arsenate/arsenite/antimonite-responsive transcriptional repressor
LGLRAALAGVAGRLASPAFARNRVFAATGDCDDRWAPDGANLAGAELPSRQLTPYRSASILKGDDATMGLTAEQFTRIAKALADPRRFDILQRIAVRGDVPCQALREAVPVTQPTLSHHLRELAAAGLVEPRREGQCVHYRFCQDAWDAYRQELDARLGQRPLRDPAPGGALPARARRRPSV